MNEQSTTKMTAEHSLTSHEAVKKHVSANSLMRHHKSASYSARMWSSSNEYTGKTPELTSRTCSEALHRFFHNNDKNHQNPLLALATEASSHPSGLVTLFAQPYVYAGGGLGNIPECPRELQTCLAGGTKRDSLTFAAVCIVPECTALDLASPDFVGALELAAGLEKQRDAIATSYIQLHRSIQELNKFLKTGWTCGEYNVPWHPFPFGVPYLLLLCGVIGLSVMGTFRGKRSRRKRQAAAPAYQHTDGYPDEEKKEPSSPADYAVPHSAMLLDQSVDDKSFHLWQAWNIRTLVGNIFRYRPETAALDGLRVMSILWIILGHVMAIQSSSGGGYNNPRDFLPPHGLTTTFGGQLLFASRFAVDTFLILSGYLVVHVLLSKLPTGTISGRFWFLRNYIRTLPGLLMHRILRILPLYGMTLGFWTQVAPYLGGGPFWYQWEPLLESCRLFGWTNWLFVNNFFPWNLANTETCFYHSWYLAVDIQLFVIAPLLVGWYRQSRVAGLWATATLLFVSVAVTVYLSFARQWSLNTFDGASVARFDVEGYAKPHVRAQAYLAGMLLAMLRHSSPTLPGDASKRGRRHCLAMAFALFFLFFVTFCTVTGAYSRRPCRYEESPFVDECGSLWSPAATFTYAALSRAFWAFAITIIMALCLDQKGGIVGQFLSWHGWTPLSNLTFGAYLVHPIVIFIWQLGGTQKETFRLLVFGMNYVSVCVVSFAAALCLSLLVELPCAALSKRYLGRRLLITVWKPKIEEQAENNGDLIQLLPTSMTNGTDENYRYGAVR